MNKICKRCDKNKPLEDYYNSGNTDGKDNTCKECVLLRVKKREASLRNDPKWLEKERERQRERYYRLGYSGKYKQTLEKKRETMKKYMKKYPEKYNTHCKSPKLRALVKGNHLHHWSYCENHTKSVIEMSEKDHNFLHRYLRYDQPKKLYKTMDGILLDSREKHLKYFDQLKKIKL